MAVETPLFGVLKIAMLSDSEASVRRHVTVSIVRYQILCSRSGWQRGRYSLILLFILYRFPKLKSGLGAIAH
jgi:hypothetical protein